jgi:chromosome partitioning protein
MVDRRKRCHREFADRLPHDRASVVAEVIPNRSVIEQMAQERAPVPVFAPTSPAATSYEALWPRVQSCWSDTA